VRDHVAVLLRTSVDTTFVLKKKKKKKKERKGERGALKTRRRLSIIHAGLIRALTVRPDTLLEGDTVCGICALSHGRSLLDRQ